MRTTTALHLPKAFFLAAALALLGSAVARADVPGYEFMMLPEGMAMVVGTNGQATKAKISDETAKAITAGAQPLSDAGIILLYRGNLYIVPDKKMGDGKMMSSMVMSSQPSPNK